MSDECLGKRPVIPRKGCTDDYSNALKKFGFRIEEVHDTVEGATAVIEASDEEFLHHSGAGAEGPRLDHRVGHEVRFIHDEGLDARTIEHVLRKLREGFTVA